MNLQGAETLEVTWSWAGMPLNGRDLVQGALRGVGVPALQDLLSGALGTAGCQ